MPAGRLFAALLSGVVAATLLCPASSATAAPPAKRPTYGEVRDLLVKHTKIVEMTNEAGTGRVIICPEYQGRIMTSTVDGLNSPSQGWVNKAFFDKKEPNKRFNNYGGEDRLWIGPEGGQFSLWFKPNVEQNLANWYTPAALNDGPMPIVSKDTDPTYRLARKMQFQNASGTQFNIEVTRELHMLAELHFGKLFGEEAQSMLKANGMKMVGFESVNTLTNRGPAMTKEKGLISLWVVGMFPPGAQTKIILPIKDGADTTLGPLVKSDYFGEVSSDRLQTTDQAAFFLGDGKFRSKIGLSQKRARPLAAALDEETNTLTLVHFSMPAEPSDYPYVNNAWKAEQDEPYAGDVVNAYNDGPPATGKPSMGGFYELESLSPAFPLATNKFLRHIHATFHVQGPREALIKLAQAALGVDIPDEGAPLEASDDQAPKSRR